MSENSSCVVTIIARGDRTVWMRLVGALDIDADPALAAAVTRLGELAPRAVVLDLAGVTFAGATLCHFLVRTRRTAPGASILMRNASPQSRFVMKVTGTDVLVTHDVELPPPSAPADRARLPWRTTGPESVEPFGRKGSAEPFDPTFPGNLFIDGDK